MARVVPQETIDEVDRQLKGGISVRAVVANMKKKNMPVSKSYIEKRSTHLRQLKKDITETAVVIGDVKNQVDALEQRYSIGEATKILTKAIKMADANSEIDKILANGATGLLMANMMGADVISKQVLKKIENGHAVNADEVINMVAINNQAPKVAETLKGVMANSLIKEESGGAVQDEISFDEPMSEEEAIELFERERKGL